MDHDGLILIAVVLVDTLDQNVEWSAQEDIVCGVVNYVKLHIQSYVSNEDQDIVGEA